MSGACNIAAALPRLARERPDQVAMRLCQESYGARYAARTSSGIVRTTPSRAAPAANALKPRITISPMV